MLSILCLVILLVLFIPIFRHGSEFSVVFSPSGKEEKNIRFRIKTYGYRIRFGPAILQVNACATRDIHGHVVRLCFAANNITSENIIVDKFIRRES